MGGPRMVGMRVAAVLCVIAATPAAVPAAHAAFPGGNGMLAFGHHLTGADDSVAHAAERMRQRTVGCLIVVNTRHQPIGMVTDRDLVIRVVADAKDADLTPVIDVMSADPVVATAILDRLLHHSHVITIRGDSYRLREKRRSGLLQKPAAAPETAPASN